MIIFWCSSMQNFIKNLPKNVELNHDIWAKTLNSALNFTNYQYFWMKITLSLQLIAQYMLSLSLCPETLKMDKNIVFWLISCFHYHKLLNCYSEGSEFKSYRERFSKSMKIADIYIRLWLVIYRVVALSRVAQPACRIVLLQLAFVSCFEWLEVTK